MHLHRQIHFHPCLFGSPETSNPGVGQRRWGWFGDSQRRLIQLLDLDIGWGHRLFGFDDQSDLIAGAVGLLVGGCRDGVGTTWNLGSCLDVFSFWEWNWEFFRRNGMVSKKNMLRMLDAKNRETVDCFEADSCVGFSKGAIFCQANGNVYIQL